MSNNNGDGFWGGLGRLAGGIGVFAVGLGMIIGFFVIINKLILHPIFWLCGVHDEGKRSELCFAFWLILPVVLFPALYVYDIAVDKPFHDRAWAAQEASYNREHGIKGLAERVITVDISKVANSSQLLDEIELAVGRYGWKELGPSEGFREVDLLSPEAREGLSVQLDLFEKIYRNVDVVWSNPSGKLALADQYFVLIGERNPFTDDETLSALITLGTGAGWVIFVVLPYIAGFREREKAEQKQKAAIRMYPRLLILPVWILKVFARRFANGALRPSNNAPAPPYTTFDNVST